MTIDKIYCINLDRRPDRMDLARKQFERHGLQVERFSAIDGNDFRTVYPIDNGNNGCTLSHYFIIERAKILGLETIMIFEDDADLHPEFSKLLTKCLEKVPSDWGQLYLGGSHREKPTRVNDHILRVNKTLTTHGYLIRSLMYDLVIDNFKNLDNPVDCFYAQWQKEYPVYITDPPLAWQRQGYSDIVGRVMNYEWIRSNNQK